MFNFKEITDKIKDIISAELGNKKVYDKDVAERLNINNLTFATMKNRNKLPFQEVLDFCASRKISINWLLYNQAHESLDETTEKYARIRYFRDIYASAGGGADVYDEEVEYLSLDEMVVARLGGEREIRNIEAINVVGDSMEPTLKDGNIVYINRVMNNISKNGIYVIATEGGLFIKRVNVKGNSYELVSDNESYPPFFVEINSSKIVGKVVGMQSFTEDF